MPERVVFVSYGQLTEAEQKLGRDIADIVVGHGMRPFLAQDVHSTSDLNSNVFEAVRTCDAFVGILQKRGTVSFAAYAPVERSSVWIQQEVAMFSYRMFLEHRQLPIRIYSERGIRREGVMDIAMMNPIEFDAPEEILKNVGDWLASPAFDTHPVLSRREELFGQRFDKLTEDARLLLELIAAHCPAPDDYAEFTDVSSDFGDAVLRNAAVDVLEARRRFGEAFAALRDVGLIRQWQVREFSVESSRISVRKPWLNLVLDRLARQGRRIDRSP